MKRINKIRKKVDWQVYELKKEINIEYNTKEYAKELLEGLLKEVEEELKKEKQICIGFLGLKRGKKYTHHISIGNLKYITKDYIPKEEIIRDYEKKYEEYENRYGEEEVIENISLRYRILEAESIIKKEMIKKLKEKIRKKVVKRKRGMKEIIEGLKEYFPLSKKEEEKLPLDETSIEKGEEKSVYRKGEKRIILTSYKKGEEVITKCKEIGSGISYEYIDKEIRENVIERKYEKYEIIILKEEGEVKEIRRKYKVWKIEKLREKKEKKKKIITLDIETIRNNENELKAVAIGWYKIGERPKIYNYKDYDYDSDLMIAKSIEEILKMKHDNYTIFIHNLGKFDYPFILNGLIRYNTLNFKYKLKIEVGTKENQVRYIEIKYKKEKSKKGYKIRVIDSLLLLPSSLKNLGELFETENRKGEIEFPEEKSLKENKNDEINKLNDYLEKDCICLYEVINRFYDIIYENFGVIITKNNTLPSVSLAIYRTHFMKNWEISRIGLNFAEIYNSAYYGGIAEVYKPYGENLYYYDINSLYPYAMLEEMPIGDPILIWGRELEEIFGFVECTIIVPEEIKIPILPCRIKEEEKGERVVIGKGKIKGWYFSEELKYAKSLGYIIKIEKALVFERGKIFKEYVEKFYELKLSENKTESYLAKIFLNSLYGRFAMSEIFEISKIVKKEERIEIEKTYKIIDSIVLENEYELIKYFTIPDEKTTILSGKNYNELMLNYENKRKNTNINKFIAAAITSYGRIITHKYKTLENNRCYYSDTDSFFLEKPLDEKNIGREIGNLKNEVPEGLNIKEAYFIAPKLYGYMLSNGEEVIKGKTIEKGKLTYEDLKSLYNGIIIKKKVERLSKNVFSLSSKNINIKITGDYWKRKKIFDNNNKWIDTEPLKIEGNKVVNQYKEEEEKEK